ncbi:MAG: histidine kinase [Frankiales bacterium]|nr:histidine kinase [Frankiales bacterium]
MGADQDRLDEVFVGGGEVAAALREVDWATTPLGPPETWSTSLVNVVRVMLASRFSMWMAWGPDLVFFCNDAYRRDTLASKFPWALGRPAREVWAEIWPDIGPRIDSVLATGEATWDEGLLLFLERSGYREETYHTFSYSPLTDDDGSRIGMLCVVSEDTAGVVGARRMALVRDLGAALTALRSPAEVLQEATATLATDPADLPFVLTYLLPPDGDVAVLASTAGVPEGHPVALPRLPLDDAVWPLPEVLQGRSALVGDLPSRFPALPSGAWDEPPLAAVVVPFLQQGGPPGGFLVAGVDRYRPLDEEHRGFVELVGGQVGAALSGARAYEQERERAERLTELDRAKTEFFTNVSHEFRTPLTLMLGPAEDALADREHPLDALQRERVEIVQRNGERLLKLVNTLLDFSRLESGGLQGAFEPVDLAAYTGELARAFSAAVERVGLTLTVDCPPLPEPVHVDREMWAKIVLNLLSNALKFTFEGGITVRLDAVDGSARLVVSDTGTGIPEDQQAGLFGRFVRVAGARSRSHEGSGIGLALVADLAAAHGGTVEVESAPGRGSAFTVCVPLGSEHLPADQLVDAPVEAPDTADRTARGFLAEALRWLTGGRTGGRERSRGTGRPVVLVVDDNADMRDYVARLLAADHEVLTASDGQQGLELARQEAPDLVLSDVMMPVLDGFGLLHALREDPLTAQVPVVLLSARAGEEATVEGLDAGADDYLAKPFSGRELLARVRANLELERVRRTRRDLERSQTLLDQAQRLARVGSWELELASGAITASEEFARQLQLDTDELGSFEDAMAKRIHPDDHAVVRAALDAALAGAPLDYEVRIVTPDGQTRTYRTLGEVERDADGTPLRLRGSNQDVSDQRAAEAALATAAATAEAAAREHRIADELQRSLLPPPDVQAESLHIAAYYRAGVEGTQVGGDWYDVVELGAVRTALVLGDVMGRGVKAAAVMGQLRSATRAYARLDLPPADVLEHLDGVVRDLGEDQIVTCVYAVYDPHEHVLTYANAGHLPPLVRRPDGTVERLGDADGPPLGTSVGTLREQRVELEAGSLLALYTDGLVERRDSDIDVGVDALARLLAAQPVLEEDRVDPELPGRLVEGMLPDGPDDDVAVLLAKVDPLSAARTATLPLDDDAAAVGTLRRAVGRLLAGWQVDASLQDDVLLLVSELTTNALVHGRPPVEVRLRLAGSWLVLEVHDGASYLPSRRRPDEDDEHGRGPQLVSLLAERWGTRPTAKGKAVWCLFRASG